MTSVTIFSDVFPSRCLRSGSIGRNLSETFRSHWHPYRASPEVTAESHGVGGSLPSRIS
jgi:hypothetical protein